MALTVYRKILLLGGGATALDGIDGAILLNLDECTVYASGIAYTYILNATSGAADDGLNIIAPDTNPGTKRWILQGIALATLASQNPPVNADLFIYRASASAWALVTSTFAQLKTALGLAITAGKTITCTENTTLSGPSSATVAGPVELATNTEALTGADTTRAITPDDLKYVLDIRVQQFYGVSWDESADTYVRTGSTAGQAVGVKLADAFLPIQRRMRRCLVSDAGIVNYYLSATDSTKKEDGVTASVLTGADGQVMVEIPKFWHRYGYAGTVHTWSISPVPLVGFVVHPSFLSGATELDFIYIAAYEGILYDTSGAAYTDGSSGQTKDFTATTGDVLGSISGKLPVTNGTRANFRAIAANRGTGWSQTFHDVDSAIQLLFLIEYASFYSQSVIGAGISNVADWAAYNNYYPIAPSGNSNVIGNASGNTAGSTSCATETTKYMSYRGIENWYGHIWKFRDGININNNIPYMCNVIANFADDTASNYINPIDALGVAITLHNADGYQATLKKCSRGFLPASVGANGATKITDYYYQNSGWRVVISGGDAAAGADGGGFSLLATLAAAYAASALGGRLCFRK